MSHRPAFSSQPNNMAQARRTQGAGWSETSAKPGPSGPEGEREATQILPAGRDFLPKGPHLKRRFGSFAAVGKGTRRRGGGTPFLCSFQRWKRNQRIAGVWLRGAPALQSPTPGPRYGGRFPGSCSSNPARAVQLIVPASAPLPLAGIFEESRAGWTRKTRRLPPAVGAGPLSAGGWYLPLRKEVQTTGKRTHAWCKQPWRPIHFRPRKNSKVSAYCGHYGPPFTCYSGKRKGRRRGEGAKAWNLFRDGAEAKRSFAERFFV